MRSGETIGGRGARDEDREGDEDKRGEERMQKMNEAEAKRDGERTDRKGIGVQGSERGKGADRAEEREGREARSGGREEISRG